MTIKTYMDLMDALLVTSVLDMLLSRFLENVLIPKDDDDGDEDAVSADDNEGLDDDVAPSGSLQFL